ncbi:Transcription factor bHLH30 [Quillaja saponaria]|uniref:Transcription factor bHLH30 n=1 Tax=Quillaja saponaria TaxID=32244 RepID=A0AAD7LXC2_QUISA|nr:Transcription factor bHLH30 [Quillaja saponaria]
MLPFQTYYGFESFLDQNPSSLFFNNDSMDRIDGANSILSSASKLETKSRAACKSHKEAERRRRQRINTHLSTLRSLLPNAAKTDKASLLAEVVQHVKELRKQVDDVASRQDGDLRCSSSSGSVSGSENAGLGFTWLFPAVSDEASLSYCDGDEGEEKLKLMKATVCCEDRPNLNRDLNRAIRSVRAKVIKAEVMTIGGRTKHVVVMEWSGSGEEEIGALKRALKAVVENRTSVGSSLDRVIMGQKRGRDCYTYGSLEEGD